MSSTKPSIVFAHGIWADGSCFNKVIPPLQAEGYEVIAAQYGLDSNVEDVAATVRALGRVSSPAILVGHSYGGSVITAAGTDDRVVGLVYICALWPGRDRDVAGAAGQVPADGCLQAHRSRRRARLDAPVGRPVLLRRPVRGGSEAGLCHSLRAGRGPVPAQRTRRRVADEAELGHRGTNDHTVNPDLERSSAKRMGATTYELHSSHVPMLSQPDRVLDVIRTAASGV